MADIDAVAPPSAASLPSDVMHLILSHLQPCDILAASCVCKTWTAAEVAHQNVLWSRFAPGVPTEKSKRAFLRSSPALEIIERRDGRPRAWISGRGPTASRDESSAGMFGFLAGLVNFSPVARFLDVLAPRRFQVLLTGLEGAGKTAILDTLTNRSMSWAERPPRRAHEFNIELIRNLSNAEVTLIEAEAKDWLTLMNSSHASSIPVDGVIVVIDSLRDDHSLVSILRDLTGSPHLARRPLLVLSNKQDLVDVVPPPSILLDALRLTSLTDRAWRLQGCCTQRAHRSGGTVLGLLEGFQWIVGEMKQHR